MPSGKGGAKIVGEGIEQESCRYGLILGDLYREAEERRPWR